MTPFRDRPIGQKALVLGIAPALCAVLLVAVASTVATYYRARGTTLRDVETESAIVSENVSAALAFNDKSAAADTVHAFRAKENITAVCVFDIKGALFAAFSQPGSLSCPATFDSAEANDRTLVHTEPVTMAGKNVGTVRVVGNLQRLSGWMQVQAFVIAGTLVLALLFSLALTRRLQRSIVTPVQDLAATVDRVATNEDYRVRATRMTDDEVGRLVDSFNGMLARIEQQREAAVSLLRREQEANQAKDEFLAAVSHELRTPLNAILGWAHIIRHMDPPPETLTRALQSIERNAKAQARVVDDLLQVSRLAAGKVQVQFQLVDLRTVVQAAVDVVRPEITSKNLRFTLRMPPDACFVAGDPGRLEQVMWNLLTNAVRFTPEGGVDLDVTASDGNVSVRVTDTGIGISPDFLPQVFDRFRQADGSASRKYGGLGLGLAIAKELTDLHGGSLRASSQGAGAGASFVLELPRLTGSDQPGAATARRVSHNLALSGVRILAVDDEPDALTILGMALRAEGAEVALASNGFDAVKTWQMDRFDVLICDLAMPQMDGFAVLRAIGGPPARDSARAFTIALTAHATEQWRKATRDAGFDAHIAKPYDIGGLVKLLRDRSLGLQASS